MENLQMLENIHYRNCQRMLSLQLCMFGQMVLVEVVEVEVVEVVEVVVEEVVEEGEEVEEEMGQRMAGRMVVLLD
jgi:hypothetical protein